jgi:hypothetical protein
VPWLGELPVTPYSDDFDPNTAKVNPSAANPLEQFVDRGRAARHALFEAKFVSEAPRQTTRSADA